MFRIENIPVRLIGSLISLTVLILFYIPVGLGIKNIGNIFGMLIALGFLVFFIFNKPISGLISAIWKTTPGKVTVSGIVIFLAAGFITAAVFSGLMLRQISKTPDKAYPAVLLGCKVNGSSPSLMLSRRLQAALKYLNENEEAIIVVSGGQGENEDISEAECMKNYLVSNGISESRILMENKSADTEQNLRFSKEILENNGYGNEIVIITDSFHQFRASMIADKLDLKTSSVSAQTPYYLLPTYWVREWFGICEQIVFR